MLLKRNIVTYNYTMDFRSCKFDNCASYLLQLLLEGEDGQAWEPANKAVFF